MNLYAHVLSCVTPFLDDVECVHIFPQCCRLWNRVSQTATPPRHMKYTHASATEDGEEDPSFVWTASLQRHVASLEMGMEGFPWLAQPPALRALRALAANFYGVAAQDVVRGWSAPFRSVTELTLNHLLVRHTQWSELAHFAHLTRLTIGFVSGAWLHDLEALSHMIPPSVTYLAWRKESDYAFLDKSPNRRQPSVAQQRQRQHQLAALGPFAFPHITDGPDPIHWTPPQFHALFPALTAMQVHKDQLAAYVHVPSVRDRMKSLSIYGGTIEYWDMDFIRAVASCTALERLELTHAPPRVAIDQWSQALHKLHTLVYDTDFVFELPLPLLPQLTSLTVPAQYSASPWHACTQLRHLVIDVECEHGGGVGSVEQLRAEFDHAERMIPTLQTFEVRWVSNRSPYRAKSLFKWNAQLATHDSFRSRSRSPQQRQPPQPQQQQTV